MGCIIFPMWRKVLILRGFGIMCIGPTVSARSKVPLENFRVQKAILSSCIQVICQGLGMSLKEIKFSSKRSRQKPSLPSSKLLKRFQQNQTVLQSSKGYSSKCAIRVKANSFTISINLELFSTIYTEPKFIPIVG